MRAIHVASPEGFSRPSMFSEPPVYVALDENDLCVWIRREGASWWVGTLFKQPTSAVLVRGALNTNETIGEKAQRGVAVHDAYVTEWHRIVRPSRTASLSETRSLILAGVFPPLDPASPVLSRRMAKASDLESLA